MPQVAPNVIGQILERRVVESQHIANAIETVEIDDIDQSDQYCEAKAQENAFELATWGYLIWRARRESPRHRWQ